MSLIALALTAAFAQDGCVPVGMSDVIEIGSPAVLVLGVRAGTNPDLWRAIRVVDKLKDRGDAVTVAVDIVHRRHQPTLDQLAAGQIPVGSLPRALQWDAKVGFPWAPYEALLVSQDHPVLAVGVDPSDPPDAERGPVQMPLGYFEVLRDGMAGADVPLRRQDTFLTWMAGQDRDIAATALDAWNGEGVLVLVVDRARVEGGYGVQWQADLLTDAPVMAVTTAWAKTPCYDDDLVWRWTPVG